MGTAARGSSTDTTAMSSTAVRVAPPPPAGPLSQRAVTSCPTRRAERRSRRAAGDPDPYLGRLAGGTASSAAVHRVDADQVEAGLADRHAEQLQPFPDDVECQASAGDGVRAGVGDLAGRR